MAVVVSIPSQSYTPRTIGPTFAIPAGTKKINATLTRESWPDGPVGGISVHFPDGTLAAGVTFNGGVQTGVDGSVITKSGIQVNGQRLNGVVQDLPEGIWTAVVTIQQTVTTAVLVERF